jgi:hypothetical protein
MCRELRDIHPALPSRWREELAENPEKAFSGNEKYKFRQDAPRVSQSAFTGARMRACGRVPGVAGQSSAEIRGDLEDGGRGRPSPGDRSRYGTARGPGTAARARALGRGGRWQGDKRADEDRCEQQSGSHAPHR